MSDVKDYNDDLLEAFLESVEEEENPSSDKESPKQPLDKSDQSNKPDDQNELIMNDETELKEAEQASYEARLGKLIILSRGKYERDSLNHDKCIDDAMAFGSTRLGVIEDENKKNPEMDSSSNMSLKELLRRKKNKRKQQELEFMNDVYW